MNDPEQEKEANLFAKELLMPEKFLRADIRKMGGIDLLDDAAVGKLADRYQVSVAVMGARLWELYKETP